VSVGSRDRWHNLDAKPIALAEHLENINVAGALAAEAVIVADQELAQPKAAAKDELHEIFSRIRREGSSKRKDGEVINSGLCQDFLFLIVCRQQQRSSGWIYYLEWMRLECDQHARNFQRTSAFDESFDDIPVPEMYPVESSDRDDGAADVGRET
jgi:hypothetical protein